MAIKLKILTDKELTVIQARSDASTPGPWDFDWATRKHLGPARGWCVWKDEMTCVLSDCENSENDARFIANARTDIPRLLSTVAALEDRYSWRPINSAPSGTHGNEILCAHGYDGDTGGPCSVDRAWWDANLNGWRYHFGLIADPQYWMSVPEFPEVK